MKSKKAKLKVKRGDFVMRFAPGWMDNPPTRRALKVTRVGPYYIQCGDARFNLDGSCVADSGRFIYVDREASDAYRENDRRITAEQERKRREEERERRERQDPERLLSMIEDLEERITTLEERLDRI